MVDKLKQAVPLAVAFGVLAFAWIEISLNFSFHWFDNGDLGNGLGLPANFHLVAPAAFITWALFFAAGADMGGRTESPAPLRSPPRSHPITVDPEGKRCLSPKHTFRP